MDGWLFDFDAVAVEKAGRPTLRGVTGKIPDHLVTVITGPSGAGKSTLLRLCNGLDVASAGTVSMGGLPLDELDLRQVRRQIGMVFQRPIPLPGSVADNLRVARPNATDDEIEATLERVGLPNIGDRDARAVSGGEAQRMCVARTLMTRPKFVLFDEPTSALDAPAAATIERLAHDLADDGIASAWVTHDIRQLRRLAHHVLVVIDGAIVQQGDLDEILENPRPDVERLLAGASP